MERPARSRARVALVAGLCALGLGAAVVTWPTTGAPRAHVPSAVVDAVTHHPGRGLPPGTSRPRGTVTLAFAGDVHFQLHLAALLDHPQGALGPIARTLEQADVTMVNLESAIAEGGTPDPKEREVPSDRYWFRTSSRALAVLAAAGVDVVTVANNHGADYGPTGLAETLRARRRGPVAVIGVGRDRAEAFAPYRIRVHGTDVAFLAADASVREGSSHVWAAGRSTPGLAAARADRPRALVAAVRAAARQADVVVVYLHWGAESRACPTSRQRAAAQALADAGADVLVGSHAHVLLGAGWLANTYVDYGLGNFLWYHDRQPETGVLRITVRDGEVVGDSWTPARIRPYGRPLPLHGSERQRAIADWRRLRTCTDLARERGTVPLPPYSWSARRIGPALQERMRSSHRPGCPLPWRQLRYLQVTYLGFDRRAHTGELAIHRHYAVPVANVFRVLYDARWPIRRMRLVDDYGGDDARSMAADNTSGFNCRRVAGSRSWSAHAFGAAIDLDPVRNPDLSGTAVAPRAGRRYAGLDRAAGAPAPPGVVTADSVVVRAFARIGWEWGGTWRSGADYQHFSARR